MPPSTDLLQGTLDVLILKTLALEPMHGGAWPNASSKSPKMCCRLGRVHSIQRCTGWNTKDGSSRTGEAQITIVARNIIH